MFEFPSFEEPYRTCYVNPAHVTTAEPVYLDRVPDDTYRYGVKLVMVNGFTRMFWFKREAEMSNMLYRLREW